jgi:glucokinase
MFEIVFTLNILASPPTDVDRKPRSALVFWLARVSALTEQEGCCLGVDVGGTKLSAAVFSPNGEISNRKKLSLDRSGAEAAADQVAALIAEYEGAGHGLRAIGIVIPGVVFHDDGAVWAPNVPGWNRYPLLGRLRRSTDATLTLDSDRAAYVLGEQWCGAARGARDVVFLAVGTGIGAGILVDGRLCRGAGDIAGAVGWFALTPEFRAGYESRGCFESEASGTAVGERAVRILASRPSDLISDLVDHDLSRVTAETVVEAARRGDAVAEEVVEHAATFLAMGIANIVSILNPEIVVLGGGLLQGGDLLLDPIRSQFRRWAQPLAAEQVRVELSALGEDAGLFGAGRLAWNAIESPPPAASP